MMLTRAKWRRDEDEDEILFLMILLQVYLQADWVEKTKFPYYYREPLSYTKFIWRLDDLSEWDCIDSLWYVDIIKMKLYN
jgi:hypothetical protein